MRGEWGCCSTARCEPPERHVLAKMTPPSSALLGHCFLLTGTPTAPAFWLLCQSCHLGPVPSILPGEQTSVPPECGFGKGGEMSTARSGGEAAPSSCVEVRHRVSEHPGVGRGNASERLRFARPLPALRVRVWGRQPGLAATRLAPSPPKPEFSCSVWLALRPCNDFKVRLITVQDSSPQCP